MRMYHSKYLESQIKINHNNFSAIDLLFGIPERQRYIERTV